MNRALAQAFPHVYCELDFTNPLELTVATILSAQSTDKRVNLTTPALFKRYRTALDYAQADRAELEELIRPTGFYRNKANSLIRLGQELVERFDGKVPATMEELVTLPGVGRKTANVILGNAFDIPGITVDTHFGRLVRRWRWTAEEDPVKVEHAVGELIERSEWTLLSHRVIFHGRRVCHARRPACGVCVLAKDCPSFGIGPDRPADRGGAGQGARNRPPAGAGRAVTTFGPLMSTSTRWTIAVLVVVAALVAALFTQLPDDGAPTGTSGPGSSRDRRDADTAEALAGPRARADLRPCPPAGSRQRARRRCAVSPLECAGDGSAVDVARAVDGRAVVLNLWAYWCAPCADELPAMAEYQQRVGPDGDGVDRASGRERDRRVVAAGRAGGAAADAAGRSAADRRRAEGAERDARHGGSALGR